ncbi:MAG: HAD-IIIA family hydrolase [Candidatus Marinimicrobia bacterium]|nr:HAD-IIIA family hydrolase [Candidatus Neomarinimicrobiota bacterium]MBL7023393.1 HAD-IIIA family hydrolase [Candidatus Neomarinimicrobiota bacterium]MBL7109726.1 HAD-IIIA family hydrolase [Candidatus Neomarinimicrobiota bacterium]
MSASSIKDKCKNIKLIATDIDGVWTDAKMYYSADGERMKSFSTYDGMATYILRKAGIPVAILTGENSEIVLRRAEKLKIENVYINEKQKLKRMHYLCKKFDISLDEVAYIGDDLNDLEVLLAVGLSAMPCSSPILDQFKPDFITKRVGGDGAFREFVDTILKYRK